jgi:hypothetical protein
MLDAACATRPLSLPLTLALTWIDVPMRSADTARATQIRERCSATCSMFAGVIRRPAPGDRSAGRRPFPALSGAKVARIVAAAISAAPSGPGRARCAGGAPNRFHRWPTLRLPVSRQGPRRRSRHSLPPRTATNSSLRSSSVLGRWPATKAPRPSRARTASARPRGPKEMPLSLHGLEDPIDGWTTHRMAPLPTPLAPPTVRGTADGNAIGNGVSRA